MHCSQELPGTTFPKDWKFLRTGATIGFFKFFIALSKKYILKKKPNEQQFFNIFIIYVILKCLLILVDGIDMHFYIET